MTDVLKKSKSYFGDGVKKITDKEKEMLKKFKYW